MRILQVITLSELGGAQSVVVNLANALSNDHEVIVAAGEKDGKIWGLLNPKIKIEKIKFLKRELSPIGDCRTVYLFHKLYKKYSPDIIHLHSSKAGVLGRMIFPKSKILYTVHGFDSVRIAHRRFLPIEKILQKRCSAIVGVSQYDERNLRAENITHNVRVVYNGIHKLPSLLKDNLPNNVNYRSRVICIARLSPPKNIKLFLQVAERLPNYLFVWIGNQQVYEGDCPDNVIFMGNIPNAGAYIEFADVFFLPSNYEGLPIVILEALSFGKPVVASNVGGISEILDGKNGFAVDNNAEKMADKITSVLENKELYNKVCDNALKTYYDKFTVKEMVKNYMKIYTEIEKSSTR